MKIVSTGLVVAFISAGAISSAQAGDSELLFFVSADYLHRSSVADDSIDNSDFTPTIDTLWTFSDGPWRVLGEFFLTDDESELERLQVGYDYHPDSTIWFGRFHQPTSVWNFTYHHGAYLQPSISKPAIENWEDDVGILPAHIAGFMLNSTRTVGKNGSLDYAVSLGLAPEFSDDELAPINIIDPDDGARRPAFGLNISYSPDLVSNTSIGLVAGYSEIESTQTPFASGLARFDIKQSLLGFHFNWENEDWQVLTAAYYVHNETPDERKEAGGWFLSAYAQALLHTSQNTNLYARIERTGNADSAGYLHLFPRFVSARDVAGFRYDFTRRQAVAVEFSRNELSGDSFTEVRVQWSAAFP
jgi:hypothetical protein